MKGRPFAELGSVDVGESEREGDHHPVEHVLVSGVLVFEVHRPEAEKHLDYDGAHREGESSLEDATWRSMEYCQADSEQPGEPADTDSHPAPN